MHAAFGLSHGMRLYLVMMTLHFSNDVANDAESTQKSKSYGTISAISITLPPMFLYLSNLR